jgi:hypothetical protein
MTNVIGWDDLLKTRSEVFVMEDEYRMAKREEIEKKQSVIRINSQLHSNDGLSTKEMPAQSKDNEEIKDVDSNTEAKEQTADPELTVNTNVSNTLPKDINSGEEASNERSSGISEKAASDNFHTPEDDNSGSSESLSTETTDNSKSSSPEVIHVTKCLISYS